MFGYIVVGISSYFGAYYWKPVTFWSTICRPVDCGASYHITCDTCGNYSSHIYTGETESIQPEVQRTHKLRQTDKSDRPLLGHRTLDDHGILTQV